MSPEPPKPRRPAAAARPRASDDETAPAEYDEDARLFYERLEQAGHLIDVDASTDVTKLPPRITHVRYPDGTVERIGFS